MPNRKLQVGSYKKLVADIAALYEAASKALAEMYWKTGQRIVEVEQRGEIKAAYGSGLLAQLSEDLTRKCGPGFSVENLRKMRRVYLDSTNQPPAADLNLTHYIEAMPVRDAKRRESLIKKAAREGLTTKQLRALVRHELVRVEVAKNLAASPEDREPPELLPVPKKGPLNTYRILDASETAWPDKKVLLLDHGFKGYRNLNPEESRGLKAGDVVEWTGTKLLKNGRTVKDLFTYRVYLESVIDGDTLWVVLDIGTREISRQKLRLRGIDCPEINTKEGQAAKKFVILALGLQASAEGTAANKAGVGKVLKDVPSLTVISSKNATFDRYEADVFFTNKEGQEIYLNNLLLEEGYAVRVRD